MSEQDPSVSAAIVYLTQNTPERRIYLKTSLYFLFRHFSHRFRYPILIFHEGDYDARSQGEILAGIRGEHRAQISFRQIDSSDFTLPTHLGSDEIKASIDALADTSYWRTDKYRMMCRWWLVHLKKYVADYKYVMRIDDDGFIEEPIPEDLFLLADKADLTYLGNLVCLDNVFCTYGMKEFFLKRFPSKAELLNKIFVDYEHTVTDEADAALVNRFGALMARVPCGMPSLPHVVTGDRLALTCPVMFFNNFHITKTAFWESEPVAESLRAVDEHGGIFYARWGDAPLQTTIALAHAPANGVARYCFKYSKRMQREMAIVEGYDKIDCFSQYPSHAGLVTRLGIDNRRT